MLRKVGRILLLGIAVTMLVFAIIDITKDVQAVKALVEQFKSQLPKDVSGIKAFIELLRVQAASAETKKIIASLCLQSFTILAAVAGILAALFNRCGFWFSIFSIILLALLIYSIVNKVNAGAFAGDKLKTTLLQLIKDVGLQIGYTTGFLILKFTNRD